MLKQTQASNFAVLNRTKEFNGNLGLEVEKEDFERSWSSGSLNLGEKQEFA